MMNKSNSKATGESKDEAKNQQSATPSTSEVSTQKLENPTTSAMSGNSASQTSQIGFQPTVNLEEDEFTVNANLVLAFAAKLGVNVFWKKLKLGEREVFALCFPTDTWTPNSQNGLTYKK